MRSNTGWPLFFSTALVCILILLTVGTWDKDGALSRMSSWLNPEITQSNEKSTFVFPTFPGKKDELNQRSKLSQDQLNKSDATQNLAQRPANSESTEETEKHHSQFLTRPKRQPLLRPSGIPTEIVLIPEAQAPVALNFPITPGSQNSELAEPSKVPAISASHQRSIGNKQKAKGDLVLPELKWKVSQDDPVNESVVDPSSVPVTERKTKGTPSHSKFNAPQSTQAVLQKLANHDSQKGLEKRRLQPCWPRSQILDQQLNRLMENSLTRDWAKATCESLEELYASKTLEDPGIAVILTNLENRNSIVDELINEGIHRADSSYLSATTSQFNLKPNSSLRGDRLTQLPKHDHSRALEIQLRHVQYDLARRLELWRSVHQFAVGGIQHSHPLRRQQAAQRILASTQNIRFEVDQKSWQDFLMLPEAEHLFSYRRVNDSSTTEMARKILSRLHSPVLNEQQWEFTRQVFHEDIEKELVTLASSELDLIQLLHDIEQFERYPSEAIQHQICEQYQNIRWRHDPVALKTIHAIDTHYRNANFRVAGKSKYLSALLGFSTRSGVSNVRTQNRSNGWALNLPRSSRAHAGSIPHHDFFIDMNQLTQMPMDPSRDGYVNKAVRNSALLVAPISYLVKTVIQPLKAADENQEKKSSLPVVQFRNAFFESLVEPFSAIGLNPQILSMESTSDRFMLRARLAGYDQLAAHTARPRAIEDCEFSLQLHHSLINNLLSKSRLFERVASAKDLREHTQGILGLNVFADDPAISDLSCSLLDEHAIKFQFENGEVNLNLFVDFGNGPVSIQATYAVETLGNQIVLLLQPEKTTVDFQNHRLPHQPSSEVMLRLLNQRVEVAIPVPKAEPTHSASQPTQELSIGQCKINRGWIGISWVNMNGETKLAKRKYDQLAR